MHPKICFPLPYGQWRRVKVYVSGSHDVIVCHEFNLYLWRDQWQLKRKRKK